MAYEEYSSIYFPCLVPGCKNSVEVTNQKTLHWYHTYSHGERPKGYDICSYCESLLPSLSVECLNKACFIGDSGCIGNGRINLLSECSRGTAYWYLMNGMHERPTMYPYCQTCKKGIVYKAQCRNVGCRGNHQISCTGDRKQGLVFLSEQKGEAFWPPKNCDDCREFIKPLKDEPSQCKCCLKIWVFKRDRQIMLVLHEPRDRFKIPDLCDGCSMLSEDEKNSKKLEAKKALRQRKLRSLLNATLANEEGRNAFRKTKTETFLRIAERFIQAPDQTQVETKIKSEAMSRVSKYGREDSLRALETALNAKGIDAGIIAKGLANPSLTDHQIVRLTHALAKLGADGKYPAGLMIRPRGDFPMTRGMTSIDSRSSKHAQAAAYEIYASASIIENPKFPVQFKKSDIATFHYRSQHNRWGSTSKQRTFESDMVIHKENVSRKEHDEDIYIDFKHSITGTPYVAQENIEKVLCGLQRGEYGEVIYVSNYALTHASQVRIANANNRISQINAEYGDDIPLIKTFVQGW